MAASVWAPGADVILANAEQSALIEKFIATAGQTIFNLTVFSYVPDTDSLRVYRNGVKLEQAQVSETNETRFTLTGVTLLAGEIIEATGILGSQDAITELALQAAASAAAAAASAATIDVSNLLAKAANLSDLADPAAALVNLGAAPSDAPVFTTVKLGTNVDTSKNFVISVPAIADGTLTIERESGQDVLTIDTAGNIAFPQMTGFGTAPIIESGSNANGKYTKFADGTMICKHTIGGIVYAAATGAIYNSASILWTFPAAFVDADIAISGIPRRNVAGVGIVWLCGIDVLTSPTETTFRVAGSANYVSASVVIAAIGRWK